MVTINSVGRLGPKKPRSAEAKLQQRLEFIEFRLFWSGGVNRKDIQKEFHISPPQASNDLAAYQSLAPANLKYDGNRKRYVRSEAFAAVLSATSTERHLRQLAGMEQGWLEEQDTWFANAPPVASVSLAGRMPSPNVVMSITDAIREKLLIDMVYSSMTGEPDHHRTIAPHALVEAQGRWYVRAWSEKRRDFRDYAMARIARASRGAKSPVDPRDDLEWNHSIDLLIAANPELEPAQKKAKEAEYQMADGMLTVNCRLSTTFYLIAEHRLDVGPGILQAYQQPLVLTNLDEVQNTREVVRKLASNAGARK